MKIIKFKLLYVLILLINIYANGQTATIKGSVNLQDVDSVLSNVDVYLEHSSIGTTTDKNGLFIIKNIESGEYTLVVSSIGYKSYREVITLSKGEVKDLKIEMTEAVLDLPAVVIEHVSMTGGSEGIKDIPGSAFYLSPKELEKFNYTDINRVLKTIPGINIQEEDGYGLRPNIGMRGTGSERSSKINLMEDGILMAPAPYAAPAAYYFPTMGRMQAIEVLKGSSQIKYGPYTTGGAINMISTQIPTELRGNIKMIGGSFGTRTIHANVGSSYKNFGFMVETFQYGSDGFKKLDGGGNTGFDKKDYILKLRFNTNKDAKIKQSIAFKFGNTAEDGNESYLGLTENDFSSNPFRRYAGSQVDNIKTSQQQYSARHTIEFSKKVLLITTAYRNNFKRNWYKLDKVRQAQDSTSVKISSLLGNPLSYQNEYDIIRGSSSPNENALMVKANNRSYYSEGIQTILGLDFKGEKIKHNIEIGIRLHQDQIDRFQWVDEYAMDNGVMELTKSGKPGTESNRIETATALALHTQYKLEIGSLSIIPGIRYEYIQQSRDDYGKNDPDRTGIDLKQRSNTIDVFIPGIGLDYKINKRMSIFSGVHKGFSPPGSVDSTLPESSMNYELGTRFENEGFSGQIVMFFNDYSNLLGTDLAAAGGLGTNRRFNGGKATASGLEVYLSYDLLHDKSKKISLPLTFSYTYTDAQFKSDFNSGFEGWGSVAAGDELPYIANHQLTTTLGILHKKYSFNISAKYVGRMRTLPGQGTILENESTDVQFVLDASASYSLGKKVSLFGNLTNFSNQVYSVARWPSGLRPGMPRAFNIGLKAIL